MKRPLIFAAACAAYSVAVVRLAPWFGDVAYRVDRYFADRLNDPEER